MFPIILELEAITQKLAVQEVTESFVFVYFSHVMMINLV